MMRYLQVCGTEAGSVAYTMPNVAERASSSSWKSFGQKDASGLTTRKRGVLFLYHIFIFLQQKNERLAPARFSVTYESVTT